MIKNVTHGQLVKGVLDYLDLMGKRYPLYAFKSSSGTVKTEDGRFFSSGKSGCPDITCCFNTGIYIGMECKVGKDKQSELQKIAQKEIEVAGGYYFIIRSMDDAQEALKWVILNSGTIK